MIGLQEYLMNNNISYNKLSQMLGISPSAIGLWFKKKYVPEKYFNTLSEQFNIEIDYINTVVNDIDKFDIRYKNKFNEYEIRENLTAIFLENKKGLRLETIIDTKNLERIKALGYYWHLRYAPNTKTYYAQATIQVTKENGKRGAKSMYLHIEIANPEHNKSIYVDHFDHDTLNNTEQNLRKTENKKNLSHRKGANSNNKTGVRNVNLVNRYGGKQVYMVQICKNGERFKWEFGLHEFNKACKFAELKRQELFGDFAGNG